MATLLADEPNALMDGPFGSKLKSEHYTDAGVRVIRLGNLGVGEFKHQDQSYVSPEHAADLKRHHVAEGDLLIAALAEPVGRCCAVPGSILPALVKADCIRFRPRGGLNRRFIMHWLNSPEARKNAERASHGVGRLRINMAAIRELPVPWVPIAEQNRIVAAIETQFSRLDAAVALLERNKANLKRARASVLKAAVEGRLVPTEAELARAPDHEVPSTGTAGALARPQPAELAPGPALAAEQSLLAGEGARGPSGTPGGAFEPASVLLARILEERRAQWTGKGKYKEPAAPDTEGLPALPEGWVWASVEQLGQVGTGATPNRSTSKFWVGGTIPWVTSSVANEAFVDRPSELVAEAALSETNLTLYPPGTILVAMYGEGKTRGRATTTRIATTTNQALAAVVTTALHAITAKWLRSVLDEGYSGIRGNSSGGVQPNLNLSIIKALPIPLPPLAEQHRIVAEVDRRLSVLSALEATVDTNLARCARLRQAILKRAFEGRLVPPEAPAYEDAEAPTGA